MSKIKAEDDKTIKDLLESNSLVFKIPINQRKFSWGEDQLEKFWEDFKKAAIDNNRHYLGVFSLISKESININFNNYEIIDGQQRITTIILLISALRDIYLAMNDENKAKKIHENYLASISTRECVNKLAVSKIDAFTFDSIVNINKGDGTDVLLDDYFELEVKKNKCRKVHLNSDEYINIRMVEAYTYFYNCIVNILDDVDNIQDKRNFLLDIEEALGKLDIILIKSDDIESMFSFFESLNNRGLQLSKMDIIRNALLKIVSEKFHSDLNEFGELWDDLLINLDDYDEMKFLKYYFMCTKENKIIQEKELPKYYEAYFSRFNTKNDLKNEISKSIEYSKIYANLFTKDEISTSDKPYIKNIKMINQLGQQACHSFLMEYLYNIKEEEKLNKVTSLIEKMMFIRIVCGESTKQLDGIFRDLINTRIKLDSSKYYDFDDSSILDKIKLSTPSTDNFSKSLKNRTWEKNDLTNYLLRKLEYHNTNNSGAKEFIIKSRKEVHIEHILPETYDEIWATRLEINQDTYQSNVNRIGNLVLLEFQINTSIKNSLFDMKKEKYKESTLEQVQYLINNYNEWNIDNINNRTNYIASLSEQIWNM